MRSPSFGVFKLAFHIFAQSGKLPKYLLSSLLIEIVDRVRLKGKLKVEQNKKQWHQIVRFSRTSVLSEVVFQSSRCLNRQDPMLMFFFLFLKSPHAIISSIDTADFFEEVQCDLRSSISLWGPSYQDEPGVASILWSMKKKSRL